MLGEFTEQNAIQFVKNSRYYNTNDKIKALENIKTHLVQIQIIFESNLSEEYKNCLISDEQALENVKENADLVLRMLRDVKESKLKYEIIGSESFFQDINTY
ncbi:hypothetical protein [Wolbachia endosymbiont of Pentidionis agamae]|uniref:hypothetical protein n=1 Tax=Wolbachia endosymbiont of Pentidionis agamae TaxID=3110435 RepID=UPI002FCEC689